MKAKRNYLLKNLILITFITLSFKSNAQNLDFDKPCYCIDETTGNPNYLYEFVDASKGWKKIGDEIKDGKSIEAMALNPVTDQIYVVKHRELGLIKIETVNGTKQPIFELIGYINNGEAIDGPDGQINIDDLQIAGLSYNPYTNTLWASHKTGHLDPKNKIYDVFFKIDPNTGLVLKDSFQDGYDYLRIPSVVIDAMGSTIYDVEDIAIHPYTGQLHILNSQLGNVGKYKAIGTIDNFKAPIQKFIAYGDMPDIKGLGFSKYGELFGTTNNAEGEFGEMLFFETENNANTIHKVNLIDQNSPVGHGNFEAFDCLNGINDLALSLSIKSFTTPLNVGNKVYLEYTIHNQGDIICSEYELAFNFTDELSGPKTFEMTSVAEPINPGESIKRTVLLPFSVKAVSSCASIYGEIVKSGYFGVANTKDGQKIYLPDIDSTPGNGMENGEDDEAMVSFNMLYSCNTDPCKGDVEVIDSDDACSCVVSEPQISGCMDANSCNFNANANCDDGSCQPIPLCNTDPCEGDLEIINPNNPCSCKAVEPQVSGCMNPSACNFNANANCDDGGCEPVPVCNVDPCEGDLEIIDPNDACSCKIVESQVFGCMDASACNFNANANCGDDSCKATPICNADACIGDVEIIDPNDACSCKVVESQVFGCTDNTALNYTPTANCDDNSCYDADSYTAVWPGDADANGIVDNTDVLYIGLAEGKSGLSRENASNNWTNQMAVDWEGSVLDINNKHQDTNGDGTINAQDLQAVELNYNKSISNGNNSNQGEKVGVFKLYQTSIPGDLPVEYDLVLDTEDKVLIHGIKGSIDLSKYFTSDEGFIIIKTETSVLEPELVFSNYNPQTKILEYALSRTDGEAQMVNKGDRLMRVMGIADDILDGGNQSKLKLEEGGIVDADGKLYRVGNSILHSNIKNTPMAANSILNFNVVTTPYSCNMPGTAEINLIKNDLNNFTYMWSNNANTYKVKNLSNGVYSVGVIQSFGSLKGEATIYIDIEPETQEEIKLNKMLRVEKKYIAHEKIELENNLIIPKDLTVEFLIGSCY